MRTLGWYAVAGLFVAGLFWLRVAHLAHTDPILRKAMPPWWWTDVWVTATLVALWPLAAVVLLVAVGVGGA